MNARSGSETLVSVVIPVYGTAAFVASALDSVLAQSHRHYEILVVNDGSPDTDLLEKVLEPFRSRITYIVQENRGLSGARNSALRVARGVYVAMLDSDDYWAPDYLASQLSVLDADPAIDVVYPDAVWVSADGKRTRQYSDEHPVGGDVSFLRVLTRDCQIFGGVTARRDSLRRVGWYDETVRTAEDLDLWLRLLKAGARIVYNDRVLVYFREREGSITSDRIALTRHVLALLEGLGTKMALTAEERAALEDQRSLVAGSLSLSEAKLAILAGDTSTAITKLTAARERLEGWKLTAAITSLRIAPGVLFRLYRLREWWTRTRLQTPGRTRA